MKILVIDGRMDVFDLSFSSNSFVIKKNDERKEGKGKQCQFFLK